VVTRLRAARPDEAGLLEAWRREPASPYEDFVHRVQASTDVENVAEQGALRRAGFRPEGVLRGAQWRAGTYHELQLWSRLRTDA